MTDFELLLTDTMTDEEREIARAEYNEKILNPTLQSTEVENDSISATSRVPSRLN